MDAGQTNYVDLLNEYGQNKGWSVHYDQVQADGPERNKTFTTRAVVNNKIYTDGVGQNEDEAMQNAAKNALSCLENDEPDNTVLDEKGNGEENSNTPNLSTSLHHLKLSAHTDTENRTPDKNFIGLLNEYCQRNKQVADFKAMERTGPADEPEFVCKVIIINKKEFPEGRGRTAEEAKQKAAQLAWAKLHGSDSSSQISPSPPSSMNDSAGYASCLQNSKDHSNSESIIFEDLSSDQTNKMENNEGSKTKSRFLEDYDSITKIGKGGFGHVFKARRKLENRNYAVKIVKFNEKACREVTTLSFLEHANIVRYYTSWTEETSYDDSSDSYSSSSSDSGTVAVAQKFLYIQMEFCEGKTLREWIDKRNNHSEKYSERRQEAAKIIKQVLEAVKHIHSKNLIHRDLKPANIMLGHEGGVKVGDFGFVTEEVEENDGRQLKRTKSAGTSPYMSPEQREKPIYGRKVDIFSLGLIYFELLWCIGTQNEKQEIWGNVRSKKFPELFSEIAFEHKLIEQMLHENPEGRPEASDLLRELNQHLATTTEHTEG